MSVIIANMTMVDNKMSIMSLIYGPPSLAHLYADKTVHIQVRRVYLDSLRVFPLIVSTHHLVIL